MKHLLRPGGANLLQLLLRPAVGEAARRKAAYPYEVPTLAVSQHHACLVYQQHTLTGADFFQ